MTAAVMGQGRCSVNKMIEGNVEYVACSECSIALTLSKEQEDGELRSLLRVGESGMRRYEGGKVR